MGMSEFYGPTDDAENIKVLKRSIELGSIFWDTADMYGSGKNEELLAKVLQTDRDKVFLCTKFGNVRGPNGEFLGVNGKPEYVREACEKSLKRLGVSHIDLYYQHRVDKQVPIEDTVRAMAELVKEGKVKYLGLSECSAATLRRAYAVHPIAAIQMEYSPWSLEIEQNGILEAARELGVAIVAYSPLGRGFLTGQYKSPADLDPTDFRRHMPRFTPEVFPKNLELVDKFTELAKKKNVTPSQLVLAWVLSQGEDFIVIPGTKKIKYLEENVGAGKVTVTKEENDEIRKFISSITIGGTRYPEVLLKALDSE
jgi:aryl-alcohol dehydrogenase-like predicted oxidoreductase